MTPKEMITVEKEVYEAVLRNSIRVNGLEVENQKLKEVNIWNSEKLHTCEKENQQLKELLKECKTSIDLLIKMNIDGINGYKLLYLLFKIDNAIGEKK